MFGYGLTEKKTNPKPILTAGSIVSRCKVISHLNNFHNAPKTIRSKNFLLSHPCTDLDILPITNFTACCMSKI